MNTAWFLLTVDQWELPLFVCQYWCCVAVTVFAYMLRLHNTTTNYLLSGTHSQPQTSQNCLRCRWTSQLVRLRFQGCTLTVHVHRGNEVAGYLSACVGAGLFPSVLALQPSDWLRQSQTQSLLFSLQWGVGRVWKGGRLTSVPASLSWCVATGTGTTLVSIN